MHPFDDEQDETIFTDGNKQLWVMYNVREIHIY